MAEEKPVGNVQAEHDDVRVEPFDEKYADLASLTVGELE